MPPTPESAAIKQTLAELAELKAAGVEVKCRCPKPCMPHSTYYRAEKLREVRRAKRQTELQLLRTKVAAYNRVADKFITKVDTGRARSTETYRELSAARALPEL